MKMVVLMVVMKVVMNVLMNAVMIDDEGGNVGGDEY